MNDGENGEGATQMTELELLKQRARVLNVPFSNNIGLESLKQRVADALEGKAQNQDEQGNGGGNGEGDEQFDPGQSNSADALNPLAGDTADAKPAKKKTLRQQIRDEQLRLIRLRITCMDPKKKDLPGEILTVANEYLGTVRKFVPFGEATEEGYHVPYCLYKMLEKRKFLNIRTRKGKNGTPVVESNWIREFAIEVLPDLTPAELKDLAIAQSAAGSLNAE